VKNEYTGIFLKTGPVGSGKSTTLHADLLPFNLHNSGYLRNLNFEDPVEIRLPLGGDAKGPQE